MAHRLRVPESKIDVVYRGRDPEVLGRRTAERQTQVRQKLGLGRASQVILAVGRHEQPKGLDILIDAAQVFLRQDSNTLLLIAGSPGRQTANLQAAISRCDDHDRIRLLGHRLDVANLLSAADVFVFPSRREGMGGAVIEAMALECPIVCTDLPVLREVTGLPSAPMASLVPPESPVALAEAILVTLEGGPCVRERVAGARQLFLERYTIAGAERGMVTFYMPALGYAD
jgi:glycosyltransferase involved in cell wall biosynthesis